MLVLGDGSVAAERLGDTNVELRKTEKETGEDKGGKHPQIEAEWLAGSLSTIAVEEGYTITKTQCSSRT